MGNCGTKPKVLKDSDEDLIPVEGGSTVPAGHKKGPAGKMDNNAPNAEEEADLAARRSEKGKDILIEDDVEEHIKRPSLSPLFHENKAIEIGAEPKTNNKTDASSEVLKLDTSPLMASNVKAPETFDVETRNDLEVNIPQVSKVKTPEGKEADEKEVNFSENWEVKFPEEVEAKDLKKTSSDKEPKLPVVSEVSAPASSEVKVTKEFDVPEVLEDHNIREVSEARTDEVKLAESELRKASEVPEDLDIKVPKVSEAKTNESEVKTDQEEVKVKVPEFVGAQEKIDKLDQALIHEVSPPELSEINSTKESYVPEVLENKNTPQVPKVKTDEVQLAESELIKVSEVKSPEGLEIEVPKVFEVKTNESEVKIDQEDSKVKVPEETDVPQFVDAQEKIDKLDQAQIHEVSAPGLSEVKSSKESYVPEVLENKNIPEVSKVKTDEVQVAESELLKVSEVKSPEGLEIKVPKNSEVKTNESDVKTDQEEVKLKILEETEVPEFVDAQEKIDKLDQTQTHEVSAPELSEANITKESYVPEVLENKNSPQVSEVKTDEVKVAESELLKVAEVKSPRGLEIKEPKVSDVKTNESEVKIDQEDLKVKIPEETEVPEFVDAQDKIDKPDQDQIHEDIKMTKDKEIVLPKAEKEDKESTLSDLGNK